MRMMFMICSVLDFYLTLKENMDWTLAVDRNRKALLRFVAALFAIAGWVEGGASPAVMPRHVRSRILRALRPTESCVRRLIFVVAFLLRQQGVVFVGYKKRTAPSAPVSRGSGGRRAPVFPLFDKRKHFGPHGRRYAKGAGPRMTLIGVDEPDYPDEPDEAAPDDLMDAESLLRRLAAVKAALEDLPKQARRLMRRKEWRETGFVKLPMRAGKPPGYRARGNRPIDVLLNDCHLLALWAVVPPDTS